MTNLALNCVKTKLLEIVKTYQIQLKDAISNNFNSFDPINEELYTLYDTLINVSFKISNNKIVDVPIFNQIIIENDIDVIELLEFYNNKFANTIHNNPNKFYFSSINNAELNTYYESDVISITGLIPNTPVAISCTGGEIDVGNPEVFYDVVPYNKYSLSGVFDTFKIINSNSKGNIIVISKAKSNDNYGITKTINVTINDIVSSYKIITKKSLYENIPIIPLKSISIVNAELNTYYESESIIISGFSPEKIIEINVENGTIDAGTFNLTAEFKSNTTVISNLMGKIIIAIKVNSGSTYNELVSVIINFNTTRMVFTIRTKKQPIVIT